MTIDTNNIKKVFLHEYKSMSKMEMRAAMEIRRKLLLEGVSVGSGCWAFLTADLAIIFGTAKLRPKVSHLLKLVITRIYKNFLVFESPVIGRVSQELGHMEPLFRVGVGGFFADEGFSYALVHQYDSTAKRLLLSESFCNHNVEFNWKGVVGIALQVPGDASVKGIDQIKEIEGVIETIRHSRYFSNATIIIRTPPLLAAQRDPNLARIELLPGVQIQTGTNANKEDFFKSIELLVTFSSTMGPDAVMRGIPACGLDSRSFLRLISSSTLADLLLRRIDLNVNYVNILANTTWKIEDIFGQEFQRIVLS